MATVKEEVVPERSSDEVVIAARERGRLDAIDLVRGLVMVIMALDHVSDYFNAAFFSKPPIGSVDLAQTTPALFVTRWVTHFCAPTFVFLAGTGAFLYGSRGRTKGALSWFLLTRGLWLVILEVTMVRLGWCFNLDYARWFGPGVIWAIGWSMVLMSILVLLPVSAVAVFGIAVIAFHNLFDMKTAADMNLPEWLWTILHRPGRFALFPVNEQGSFVLGPLSLPQVHFETGYCVLPWLGVMCAGYGLGALFLLDRRERRQQLIGLGVALTALFVVLRAYNLYGDPAPGPWHTDSLPHEDPGPWSRHENPLFTLFSFVNCQKYPPSLLYLLMTLGPAIAALALFDRPVGALGRFFVTFGRVPLFFYLLHIPLIHGLLVAFDYRRFGSSPMAHDVIWSLDPKKIPDGYGVSLPVVYLIWAGVILALYPLCWWFARIKSRYRSAWLSYL
jgi:uncharacterized membrane protein